MLRLVYAALGAAMMVAVVMCGMCDLDGDREGAYAWCVAAVAVAAVVAAIYGYEHFGRPEEWVYPRDEVVYDAPLPHYEVQPIEMRD